MRSCHAGTHYSLDHSVFTVDLDGVPSKVIRRKEFFICVFDFVNLLIPGKHAHWHIKMLCYSHIRQQGFTIIVAGLPEVFLILKWDFLLCLVGPDLTCILKPMMLRK